MATLKQETIFFNDAFGRIRPNAKMYFYEAGTTTPKNTFADRALEYPNPWPLVADGAGVFPITFLGSGGYRIVYEDQDGVQFDERDDINVSDSEVSLIAATYFDTLIDLKQGISFGGLSVDLQVGQMARTSGDDSIDDSGGAEWLIVAAETGTADDYSFIDLDNGLQAKRLFNQSYTPITYDGFISAQSIYALDGLSGGDSKSLDAGSQNTDYSYGPTGSGADYEWTALDILPLNASFADIAVDINMANISGGSTAIVRVRFKSTGGVNGDWLTVEADMQIGGSVELTQYSPPVTTVRVPLDSENKFTLNWQDSGTSGFSAVGYVSGFGV